MRNAIKGGKYIEKGWIFKIRITGKKLKPFFLQFFSFQPGNYGCGGGGGNGGLGGGGGSGIRTLAPP
jgi:hypothetical protein